MKIINSTHINVYEYSSFWYFYAKCKHWSEPKFLIAIFLFGDMTKSDPGKNIFVGKLMKLFR